MGLTFGLALDFASLTRTLDRQLEQYVPLIHLAETLGFDSVSAGEGYPQRPIGGHLPSPLLALAALAPQTRLRLGTGVTLLPGWHPLKLAYEAAVLDQISGGRFFLGVGLGGAALHQRFGLDPSRVADYVDDTLATLRALWDGADGYHGKYLTIDGSIGVRPVQPGGPPILVGGSIRRSVERAATWGQGYIASSNYAFGKIAQQSGRYREALAARGQEPSSALVMVNRLTVVAEDETAARQAARPYAGAVLQNYARAGALGSDPAVRAGTPEALLEQFDSDWCFVGTPEQVVGKIQRYADAGVTHIQARVCPGDMPADLVARTLELMGKAVLPEFR